MNDIEFSSYRRYAMAAGLAMALGPLTALSVASLNSDADEGRVAVTVDRPSDRHESMPAVAEVYAGKRLSDVASGAGSLDLFGSILTAANVDQLLSGEEPYTVFIPVNEAFSRFSGDGFSALLGDPSQAEEIAKAHVVSGRVTTTTLMGEPQLRTINGRAVNPASGPVLTVNGATVIGSEVAENGIVHYVDGLL